MIGRAARAQTRTLTSGQIRIRTAGLRERMMALSADDPRYTQLRNEIVELNMGLVATVAQRLASQYGFHNHDQIGDVTNEVALTLTKIIPQWDPNTGGDLGAALWAASRSTLRKMRDHASGLGGSVRARRTQASVEMARQHLTAHFGREPSASEIAEYCRVPIDQVHELTARFEAPVSLTGVDVADAGAAVAAAGESAAFIASMAAMLTERDPQVGEVFATRFGLTDPPPPETLAWVDVAERCAISVPTAQRRVAIGRQWVAEWLMAQTP